MANITFPGLDEFGEKLRQLEAEFLSDEPIERAVAKGAKPVADGIRTHLQGVPTEPFRRLRSSSESRTSVDSMLAEKSYRLSPAYRVAWKKSKGIFHSLSNMQLLDMLRSFGLTPVKRDNGFVHTKAGFDGYGSFPTKTYPNGVPNQLLARAVESGSSVRQKHPFVRPAVNATKNEAIREMEKSIDEDLKKIF